MTRGKLILIEGLDRSGKSTQAEALSRKLADGVLMKFPDRSTQIGELIDKYLTEQVQLSDQSAHLLFSANRWEQASTLREYLNSGKFVVLDRYVYSGIAYSLAKSIHVKGSSEEMSNIKWLYAPDIGLPKPDLTLFLTLPLSELSERKGWGDERYEKEEFQKNVKKCFLSILDPAVDKSIEILDVGRKSINEVSALIYSVVQKHNANVLTGEPISCLK